MKLSELPLCQSRSRIKDFMPVVLKVRRREKNYHTLLTFGEGGRTC